MSDSKPNLQLAPAPIAPLHNGSVYQTGQNNTDNAVKQQMALIGSAGGKSRRRKRHKSNKRRRSKRRGRKSQKTRKRRRRRRKGGDAIKPQVFTPGYPQPPGSVTPNQNSAAITKLFAGAAANAEFDGKVGSKSGGKRSRSRKCRSCLKRHGRKSRKKRGGVRWGCMS